MAGTTTTTHSTASFSSFFSSLFAFLIFFTYYSSFSSFLRSHHSFVIVPTLLSPCRCISQLLACEEMESGVHTWSVEILKCVPTCLPFILALSFFLPSATFFPSSLPSFLPSLVPPVTFFPSFLPNCGSSLISRDHPTFLPYLGPSLVSFLSSAINTLLSFPPSAKVLRHDLGWRRLCQSPPCFIHVARKTRKGLGIWKSRCCLPCNRAGQRPVQLHPSEVWGR